MAMLLYRCAHALHRAHVSLLPRVLYAVNRIVFAAVVPPGAQLGRDVLLGYKGLGIVIHRRAVIGDRVNIGSGVTIGGRGAHQGVPVIEDDVLIGTGAKMLGPVRVGRGARIGANAVALHDVPAGATAVGVPARIVATGGAGGHAPLQSQSLIQED